MVTTSANVLFDLSRSSPIDAIRFQGMKPLTLSGLLNALDGVISTEGRIIFMTTNFIERYAFDVVAVSHVNLSSIFSLDPALIRPGRVDYKQYIGPLTAYQVEQMLIRFYPQSTSEEIDRFQKLIERVTENYSKELSAAQLQGYFMHNKDSLEHIFENTQQLFRV
jgi:chaperone BCS1